MKILQIENKTGKVTLDDTVDGYSRKQLAREMSKVFGAEAFTNPDFTNLTNDAGNQVDRLEITINSPGGSVFDGLVIVNELKAMSAKGVRTVAIVNVLAASMGSVIAASCDECQIVDNGKMMIHDVSVGVRGTSKDLQRLADLCEGMSNEVAGIYAAKTGKTSAEMRALMQDETWFDAKQAVAIGLADGIFDIRQPKATMEAMNLLDRLTSPSASESIEKIEALETVILNHDAEIADFKAKLETAEAALQEAAGFKGEIETLSAKLNDADKIANENAQTITDLQAAVESAKNSAAQSAVEIAAAAGIEAPLAIEGNGTVTVDHLAEIGKLSGVARTEYMAKHGKEIRAQMLK